MTTTPEGEARPTINQTECWNKAVGWLNAAQGHSPEIPQAAQIGTGYAILHLSWEINEVRDAVETLEERLMDIAKHLGPEAVT